MCNFDNHLQRVAQVLMNLYILYVYYIVEFHSDRVRII